MYDCDRLYGLCPKGTSQNIEAENLRRHCLLIMLEKLRGALDKGLVTGILLTDLSKAFDSISHELLAAKLYVYRFSKNSVKVEGL